MRKLVGLVRRSSEGVDYRFIFRAVRTRGRKHERFVFRPVRQANLTSRKPAFLLDRLLNRSYHTLYHFFKLERPD